MRDFLVQLDAKHGFHSAVQLCAFLTLENRRQLDLGPRSHQALPAMVIAKETSRALPSHVH